MDLYDLFVYVSGNFIGHGDSSVLSLRLFPHAKILAFSVLPGISYELLSAGSSRLATQDVFACILATLRSRSKLTSWALGVF